MSQLMAFVASLFRRLVTVWTLFDPVPRLSTDQASVSCLVPQGLGVCHRASLEGGQDLEYASCLSFSPFPAPWPSSPVLCYKRYWWLSVSSHLKRQQSPAAVAVVTVS